MKTADVELSVVVPVYNERPGLPTFHTALLHAVQQVVDDDYEILYCNDGSTDGTAAQVREWAAHDARIRLLSLTRNFGKEIATTAGLHIAKGRAIITIDADGQHPVELIPQFVDKWRQGSKVVVGLRTSNQKEGWVKRAGSKIFHAVINKLAHTKVTPGSDFRLIDREVQQAFLPMTERNRITRGLLDWLGYECAYIAFAAKPRLHGEAAYSFNKLVKLFFDSLIALSIAPLFIIIYIGAAVLSLSTLLGVGMIANLLLHDPLQLHATGSAYLIVLILFLVGLLLMSQGIVSLYISHIHTETQNRPLYVIDKENSKGIDA